jgi:hypothetical protein
MKTKNRAIYIRNGLHSVYENQKQGIAASETVFIQSMKTKNRHRCIRNGLHSVKKIVPNPGALKLMHTWSGTFTNRLSKG